MSDDIVIELDDDVLDFMWKCQRDELIDMVRHSWLPPRVMRSLFDLVRPEGGMLIHLARLSMSHPNAEVRAMATVELCAFVPVDRISRFLWR